MSDLPIDVLVNKENVLPMDYVPEHLYTIDDNENNFRDYADPSLKPMLRFDVMPYLYTMTRAAIYNGADFIVDSGYRSYQYQQDLLNKFLARMGDEAYSKCALPGTSEHQTGLAFDVSCVVDGVYKPVSSEEDIAIKWLKENSWRYGFILRYPAGKEKITGFNYERWHYRFVGDDLAKYLFSKDLTLEEFYAEENRGVPRTRIR